MLSREIQRSEVLVVRRELHEQERITYEVVESLDSLRFEVPYKVL